MEAVDLQAVAKAPATSSMHEKMEDRWWSHFLSSRERRYEALNNITENSEHCFIREDGHLKERFDVVVMLCIVYSAVVVPFRIAFRCEAQGWAWVLEVSMSLLFVADLVLTFNTAYTSVDGGELVTARGAIASRYIRGWFCIDALSSVPVELIELALSDSEGGGVGASAYLPAFRLLRLLRLVRMLRLLKLGSYISRIEDQLDINLRPLKVIELVLQMLFFAHILACGWFLTTWLHDDGGDTDGVPDEADEGLALRWIDTYDEGSARDGPAGRQYYLAFYWALTVVTAVNPIQPNNDVERNFLLATNLVNRLFFAYVIGKITGLIANLDRSQQKMDDKMDLVKEYLRWRGTPRKLAIRVKRFYEFFYAKDASHLDEASILRGLSPQLNAELVQTITKQTLGRLPLFAKLSPEFQTIIFPLVKPMSYAKGEMIFASGAVAGDLLFLLEGSVDFISGEGARAHARAHASYSKLSSMPCCSCECDWRSLPSHALPTRTCAHRDRRPEPCALAFQGRGGGAGLSKRQGATAIEEPRLLWAGGAARHPPEGNRRRQPHSRGAQS
jgi:hypothetical protein